MSVQVHCVYCGFAGVEPPCTCPGCGAELLAGSVEEITVIQLVRRAYDNGYKMTIRFGPFESEEERKKILKGLEWHEAQAESKK